MNLLVLVSLPRQSIKRMRKQCTRVDPGRVCYITLSLSLPFFALESRQYMLCVVKNIAQYLATRTIYSILCPRAIYSICCILAAVHYEIYCTGDAHAT